MKLCTLCVLVPLALAVDVQVAWNSLEQRIDGFGASAAFTADEFKTLPAATSSTILDKLFSPTTGAGLSIVRVRLSPYTYVSGTGAFDGSTDPDEIGTRWFLSQASTRGATRFLSTPWTPPAPLKSNNNVNGGAMSSSNFQAYADFLTHYVQTMQGTYSLPLYSLSVQNEPQIEESYESCVWTPAQLQTFIGTYLKPAFVAAGLTTKIMAADGILWDESAVVPTLTNAVSAKAIDIVSAHPYHAGEMKDYGGGTVGIGDSGFTVFPYTKKNGKALWATEFCNGTSNIDTIGESVRIATLIHKHMTVPESNAFLFWWAVSDKPDVTAAESLVFFDVAAGTYIVRKRLWALGQFARFVRPGFVRIAATAEPVDGVHASAYREIATGKLAIVAINENSAASSVTFKLFGCTAASVSYYRTSASENMAAQTAISVSGGQFTVSLPAQSINTFSTTATTQALPALIDELANLDLTSGSTGDLTNKFVIATIDPSNSGGDTSALVRQTNTAEWVQWRTPANFNTFVLTLISNGPTDSLGLRAVLLDGSLAAVVATRSTPVALPGYWFTITYTVSALPLNTVHLRVVYPTSSSAEWTPQLRKMVMTYK